MANLILNYLRDFVENNNKCCSNCIVKGDKESLQCIDLDPPQIVNEIVKLNTRNIVIGLDCNQIEHKEELASEAIKKVFGTDLNKIEEFQKSESESENQEKHAENYTIPRLETKKEAYRTIKFQDYN